MKYCNMTPAQKEVFEKAKELLQNRSWFRGICTDNFPSNNECVKNPILSVNSVMAETRMWDEE